MFSYTPDSVEMTVYCAAALLMVEIRAGQAQKARQA